MRERRLIASFVLLLLPALACGRGEDEETADPPAEVVAEPAPAEPAEPPPPPEEPPEEEGLRGWAAATYGRVLIAIRGGDVRLDPESMVAQLAQVGHPVQSFAVGTYYFTRPRREEGLFALTAMFYPARTSIRYTRLNPARNSALAQPSRDDLPELTLWDQIIRRRITEEGCAFPLLRAEDAPPGLTADDFSLRAAQAVPGQCEMARTILEGGGRRSRHYLLTWSTDAGGGSAGLDVGADGTPSFDSVRFWATH